MSSACIDKDDSRSYEAERFKIQEITLNTDVDYKLEYIDYDLRLTIKNKLDFLKDVEVKDIISININGQKEFLGLSLEKFIFNDIRNFKITNKSSEFTVILYSLKYDSAITMIYNLQKGDIESESIIEEITAMYKHDRELVLKWMKTYPEMVNDEYSEHVPDLMLLEKLEN